MATTCDCPHPPGGRAECADNQMAICVIENGVAVAHCVNPPPDSEPDSLEFQNWVLEHVTQTSRRSRQTITQSDRRILESGEYEDRTRGIRVSFQLPRLMGGTATA